MFYGHANKAQVLLLLYPKIVSTEIEILGLGDGRLIFK